MFTGCHFSISMSYLATATTLAHGQSPSCRTAAQAVHFASHPSAIPHAGTERNFPAIFLYSLTGIPKLLFCFLVISPTFQVPWNTWHKLPPYSMPKLNALLSTTISIRFGVEGMYPSTCSCCARSENVLKTLVVTGIFTVILFGKIFTCAW